MYMNAGLRRKSLFIEHFKSVYKVTVKRSYRTKLLLYFKLNVDESKGKIKEEMVKERIEKQ